MSQCHFSLENKVITSLNVQSATISSDNCFDSGDYVYHVAHSVDGSTLIASSSNNSLYVYDSSNLTCLNSIKAHDCKINAVEMSPYSKDIVMAGFEDGSIKVWDIRQCTNPIVNIKLKDEVYDLSLGLGGMLLAVGNGQNLSFLDPRKMTESNYMLGEYTDIHADLVTQVKFCKQSDAIVASGSEDGLICVLNTAVNAGEEAVMSVLNTESPIQKIGFFGPNNEGIYAVSTIETLSLWHSPSSQRLIQYQNIREQFELDYLVDCIYDNSADSLMLVAGKHDGTGTVLKVEPQCLTSVGTFNNGHSATIRCVSGNSYSRFFTGAEDSRVCCWKYSADPLDNNLSRSLQSPSNKIVNKKSSSKKLRHSPY